MQGGGLRKTNWELEPAPKYKLFSVDRMLKGLKEWHN